VTALPTARPAPPSTPAQRPAVTRPSRVQAWYPVAALVGGMVVIAGLAAIVGTQVSVWALDETLHKASAVHYGSGLPDSLFHDLTARATTRLYPLTLTPLFEVFDGDVAVRIAKVWNALLFVSAAVPSYLIARSVLASRWGAVAAALLCVALPWLTLSTALFTESLAYPVSVWLSYSILRSVRDPSPRRDAIVLLWCAVAVASRFQLVAIFGGYVVLLVALALVEAPTGTNFHERMRVAVARMRQTPFALATAAAGVILILLLAVSGSLEDRIYQAVGAYGEFQNRTTVPSDVPTGALVEFISFGLGVGVVPMILALAWYPATLRARLDPAARALAMTAVAVTGANFAFILAAQDGFWGQFTEERYFIYSVPFLWVGAFAALERPRLSRTAIAWAGALFTILCGVVALPYTFGVELFLAPAGKSVVYLSDYVLEDVRSLLNRSGLTSRDLLFVVVGAVAVLTAASWRRAPWARRWLLTGAAAAQILLTAFAFLAIDGRVGQALADHTLDPPVASRGWIDRAAGDQDVTWLQTAQWSDPNGTTWLLRETSFWNDAIRHRAQIPAIVAPSEGSPVDALPTTVHKVTSDGRFTPDLPPGLQLVWAGSPFLQIHGRLVADDEIGQPFFLAEPVRPARAQWLATGLRSDGAVLRGSPVRIAAWPGDAAALVRLELTSPTKGAGVITVRLGGEHRVVRLRAGRSRVIRIPACGVAPVGSIRVRSGVRQPDGSTVGAVVRSVFLEPAGSACRRDS
jgi:hypothetical protein